MICSAGDGAMVWGLVRGDVLILGDCITPRGLKLRPTEMAFCLLDRTFQ